MRPVVRGMVGAIAAGLLIGLVPATASARGPVLVDVTPPDADPTDLLERYAPVLALRRQDRPCGEGEPYFPIAVEHVLGREDVELLDGAGDVVTTAPVAADLAARPADWALDFPGDALDPGCDYELWFDSMGAEPAVYGRAVVDGDLLVAQYWLYYVYNDWNDRHESDWEMIQLVFDATTVAAALEQGPVLYAYAQHEGSEYAFLDDTVEIEDATETERGKVRLVSGAPVVYPAQGSHAAYFNRDQWFGKSGATGFGCDDTSAPLIEVRPGVIVLPTRAPTEGELAWLSFEGHWGERRPMFNDGPTGPAMKDQWDEPVAWVEELGRADAVPTPFGGSPATDAFCEITRDASALFLQLLDHPVRFTIFAVLILIALVAIVRYSSRGLLRSAARTYRRHPVRLAQIGGALIGAGALGLAAHWLILRVTSVGDVLDVLGDDSPWAVPVLAAVASIVSLPVMAWVLAATVELTVDAGGGQDGSDRAHRRRGSWWLPHSTFNTFVAALILVVIFSVASILPILLPIAAAVAAGWLVSPVVCADQHVGAAAGLRGSAQLLRGQRLRAIGVTIILGLILAAGGVAAAALLVLTEISFSLASLVVVLVAVVLVPYVGLVLAHFYVDLRAARSGVGAVGQLVDVVEPGGDVLGVVGGPRQQGGADREGEQLEDGRADR